MSAVSIAKRLSEWTRWAMFLCGQDFETADAHLSLVGTVQPEISNSLERYVLSLSFSSTEIYFLVFDSGTKYTSQDLPSWATPECVFEMDVSKPETGATLARLKRLTQEIVQTIDLPDSLKSDLQRRFESITGADGEVGSQRLLDLLQPIINAPRIDSCGLSEQYITAMRASVSEAFYQFRVTGDLARRVIAYSLFMWLHPSSDELYLGNFFSVALPPSRSDPILLPILGLNHYFELPENDCQSSFIVARGAARLARRTAKDYLSRAIRKHTLGEFFGLLYAALLCYRVGMSIYDEMMAFAKTNPEAWSDSVGAKEVKNSWIECEEARVAILLSLQISIVKVPGFPSIFQPNEFLGWVDEMAAMNGPDVALEKMSEGVIALQYPEFLRDLAHGHLVTTRGARRDPARIAKALARHIDALGDVEDSIRTGGEPVYQVLLLRVIMEMHHLSGEQDALEVRRRQHDELMRRLQPAAK